MDSFHSVEDFFASLWAKQDASSINVMALRLYLVHVVVKGDFIRALLFPESSSGDGFSFRFRGPGVGERSRPEIAWRASFLMLFALYFVKSNPDWYLSGQLPTQLNAIFISRNIIIQLRINLSGHPGLQIPGGGVGTYLPPGRRRLFTGTYLPPGRETPPP